MPILYWLQYIVQKLHCFMTDSDFIATDNVQIYISLGFKWVQRKIWHFLWVRRIGKAICLKLYLNLGERGGLVGSTLHRASLVYQSRSDFLLAHRYFSYTEEAPYTIRLPELTPSACTLCTLISAPPSKRVKTIRPVIHHQPTKLNSAFPLD